MHRPSLLRLRVPKRLSAFALLLAAGVAASFALVVNASTATVNTTLSVSATAENSCAPTALTAPAGTVTIVYTNTHDYQQNFGIQGVGWASPQDVRRGGSATISAQLAPGTYTFWCGDRPEPDKSTTGTLTVTATGSTTSVSTTAPGTTTTPPPAPSPLSVTVGDNFFQPTALSATAGTITVDVTNTGSSSHTWTIANVVSATLSPGQSKTVTFSAAAGSYRFYCAYHSTMAGTLTVDPAPAPPPGTTTTAPPTTTPPPTTPPPTTTVPPPPPGAGSSSASVTATDFAFTPNTVDVPAGTITLTFANHGSLPHSFTVDGLANVRLDPGQTQTVTFAAGAGTYRIYCAEPGHADMGMVGTLRVGGAGGAPPPPPTGGTTTPPGGTTTTPAAGGGGGDVTVTDFAFAPSTITRPAGTVTFSVSNRGRLPHTLTIDGLADVALQPGETKTVSFDAAPGSYRIYCAVSGHAALGMTATLVVTGPGGSSGATAPAATTTTTPMTHDDSHTGATAAPAAVPVTCVPRAVGAFTLTGTVAGTTRSRLLVTVTGATTKVRARYAGKTVAVSVSGRTRFLGAVTDGLKPGLAVKVTVGRCGAHQSLRPATQVVLSAPRATAPAAPGTLELHADAHGMPAFDKTSLTAPAGKVTLRLVNPSPLEHNITLDGYGSGKTVAKGGVSTVTADLKAGTYKFFCSVPGHAQAGMKGTLVVR